MMKFSDECGKMHKLRWIGLPEGLPSAVLARILCTEGVEALRVGRVCVVLADRFPAVPFGGSNSFIHAMRDGFEHRLDVRRDEHLPTNLSSTTTTPSSLDGASMPCVPP